MRGDRGLGLTALLGDAVEHGSRAVERVQIESARRPFALLEAIPPLRAAARIVHALHDASVASTHAAIRLGGSVAVEAVAVLTVAAARRASANVGSNPGSPRTT